MAYGFLDFATTLSGEGGTINLGADAGAADEGVSVEMVEDKSTMVIGADGTPMHSLHASTASKISVKLLKTSPTNSLLMSMYNEQTSNPAQHGKNVMTIASLSTGELITITDVAFKKVPTLAYGKEAGTNEWLFDGGRTTTSLGTY